MDLRVRGALSDEVVMRVRASAPALYRGIIFDNYDGVAWNAATRTLRRTVTLATLSPTGRQPPGRTSSATISERMFWSVSMGGVGK